MRRMLRYKTKQLINYSACDGVSESEPEEDMNGGNEQDNNRERNNGNELNQRGQSSNIVTHNWSQSVNMNETWNRF